MTEEKRHGKAFQLPTANDVLFGKGHVSQTHPGNRHYRNIIVSKKRLYVKTKKHREKDAIARQVLHEIQTLDPPGRFMARTKDGMWQIQGEAMAISKIKQALRENNSRKNFNPSVWCQDDSNPNVSEVVQRNTHPITGNFPNRPWGSPSGQMGKSDIGRRENKWGTKDNSLSSPTRSQNNNTGYAPDGQVLSNGSESIHNAPFSGQVGEHDARRQDQNQLPISRMSAQRIERSSQNDGLLLLSHVALLSNSKN
jgi:hypothetical protein